MSLRSVCVGALFFSMLTGCNLAPAYKKPDYLFAKGWDGQGIMRDARGPKWRFDIADQVWWKKFGDPFLNQMEADLLKQNPTLKAASEAYLQARDIARETESQLYPQVGSSAGMSKNKASLGRLFFNPNSRSVEYESNEFYSGAATWEPDFWNSIRNTTRMQKNLAQATAAEYALTRLLLEAQLASAYIGLRGMDAQLAVYEDSIRYFKAAVEITRLRQGGAIGAGLDVSRAENQLYSTQGGFSRLMAQRQVLEHAIAALLNRTPAEFHVSRARITGLTLKPVRVETGLPSSLLERRPDIAAAEREMAAASRAVGVSRAAFFPHVRFSADGGFMDGGFDLASLSQAFWTIAVQAVEPVFTGGLRRAALQRSWAQYRQKVDQYRAVVLNGFADVEDGLSESHYYQQEKDRMARAVGAAMRTQSMTMALYTGGLSNYLDALVAQQAALSARLLMVQAQTRELQAIVRLIRALGGGWQKKDLPGIKDLTPISPFQYQGLDQPDLPPRKEGKTID